MALIVIGDDRTSGFGARFVVDPRFDAANDFGSLSSEDLGEFEDCAESRTLNTTFEQANVGSIEATLEGEFFLGKTPLGADLTERLTERVLRAGSGVNVAAALLCQQPHAAMLTTIIPRIIVRMYIRPNFARVRRLAQIAAMCLLAASEASAITGSLSPSNPTVGVTNVSIVGTASPNATVTENETWPDGTTHGPYTTTANASGNYSMGPFIIQGMPDRS